MPQVPLTDLEDAILHLEEHCDEGTPNERVWQSDELKELIQRLRRCLAKSVGSG